MKKNALKDAISNQIVQNSTAYIREKIEEEKSAPSKQAYAKPLPSKDATSSCPSVEEAMEIAASVLETTICIAETYSSDDDTHYRHKR